MDMIETMVNFRPREFWPRRKLRAADALSQGRAVYEALIARGVIRAPRDGSRCARPWSRQAVKAALALFDVAGREYAFHRNQEMLRSTGGISPTSLNPTEPEEARVVPLWRRHVEKLDGELLARAAPITRGWSWSSSSTARRSSMRRWRPHREASVAIRVAGIAAVTRHNRSPTAGHHHEMGGQSALSSQVEPQPVIEAIQDDLSRRFGRRLLLWKVDRDELAAFDGELDKAVQMPGWTNVWTMPIQNRVDMLATGVNTPIGIRVLGRNLDDVVRGSEEVARVVKPLRGAVDVVADPVRGKPYDRNPAGPRPGCPARRPGWRHQRDDRDGPGRQGGDDDRRGPGAAPGRRPLRRGLARR